MLEREYSTLQDPGEVNPCMGNNHASIKRVS